eukprot:scaffold2633_cov156-Amphora_coffeaeformis.AAC.9
MSFPFIHAPLGQLVHAHANEVSTLPSSIEIHPIDVMCLRERLDPRKLLPCTYNEYAGGLSIEILQLDNVYGNDWIEQKHDKNGQPTKCLYFASSTKAVIIQGNSSKS